MKTPANYYLIKVDKERRLGKDKNLIAPIDMGTESAEFAQQEGTVIGLPAKFTTKEAIPSSAFGKDMTIKDIEHGLKNVKEGDTVFFEYIATIDDERLVFEDETAKTYSIPGHLLIAIKRGDTIEATACKVLLDAKISDEFVSEKLISPWKKKECGFGRVIHAQNKSLQNKNVVYLEKFASYIDIEGKRYDVVYEHEVYAEIN
jgi:co-chaperonin GroES (HSP10)